VRLDLFTKLKRKQSLEILSLGIQYSIFGLVRDVNYCEITEILRPAMWVQCE